MENFESIGIQLPLIITFWVFIGLLALAVGFFLISGADFGSGFWLGAIFTGGFAAIALIVWLLMLVPFDTKYHHIYRVTGEVTAVSNVLSESGGGLTRTPVITLSGVDRDITMNDPRSVNLKGKQVQLTCSIGWKYQAADEYSCNIYSIK